MNKLDTNFAFRFIEGNFPPHKQAIAALKISSYLQSDWAVTKTHFFEKATTFRSSNTCKVLVDNH